MIKILAAIGLGSALMLAPALAFAEDAPAAAPAKTAHVTKHVAHHKKVVKKPVKHHRHHRHHVVVKKATKPAPAKPAEAPKS
jgi:hypothetical protein